MGEPWLRIGIGDMILVGTLPRQALGNCFAWWLAGHQLKLQVRRARLQDLTP